MIIYIFLFCKKNSLPGYDAFPWYWSGLLYIGLDYFRLSPFRSSFLPVYVHTKYIGQNMFQYNFSKDVICTTVKLKTTFILCQKICIIINCGYIIYSIRLCCSKSVKQSSAHQQVSRFSRMFACDDHENGTVDLYMFKFSISNIFCLNRSESIILLKFSFVGDRIISKCIQVYQFLYI